MDRLERACVTMSHPTPWHHSRVVEVITRRLLSTCQTDNLAAIDLTLATDSKNTSGIDHLFDTLLDICFNDCNFPRDPKYELYLAEHVVTLLQHSSLRAVLHREQIDHVMSQLIVLLRAGSSTNQILHRLIRKVNEFSGEGAATIEDKSRDQHQVSMSGDEHIQWRALLQSQSRDAVQLGNLINHVPHMFSSLPTLIRLVPQLSHVITSRREITSEYQAHIQRLFLDTLNAPLRTLMLLREIKRDLSDDQLLHVAPDVIGTLLPILVRGASEAQYHHVINTFISTWKRVHRLNPDHVMQWTTRALIDDSQQLLLDPLRLFTILPNMVVHPHLFSTLFLEVNNQT